MERIIVDSCCDLTPAMKNDMNIVTVPLTMMLGDKEFCDDENLDLADFMHQLDCYPGKPGSAAPSPYSYQEAIANAGKAFIVTLSSKLSASYSNAVIGKNHASDENESAESHVFDSKSASAGETLIAIKLFELLRSGMHRDGIIETVTRFIDNMKTYFVLENYDNLQKNGRMSKVAASLVSLLNIKLIAGSDGNGEIAVYEKCLGEDSMIERLPGLIAKSGRDADKDDMVITHCNNPGLAQRLKELIENRFNFRNIYIVPTRGLSSLYADEKGVIMAF